MSSAFFRSRLGAALAFTSAQALAPQAARASSVQLRVPQLVPRTAELLARARARRRADAIARATMPWTDHQAIKALRAEARVRGMHVDHVVPLRGRNVSGLHVHQNMQLLDARANVIKGNRFDPDEYE